METGKTNNIKAKTFNHELAEQYHLSVQIGLQQLLYCITNLNTNAIEYFKEFIVNDNITNLISADEILKLNFAYSTVIFTNYTHTLVPSKIFSEKNKEEILKLNGHVYEVIKSDEIKEINAHLIYTIPKEIHNFVSAFFPNAKNKSQQTLLIELFSKMDNQGENAYLHLNAEILNITVFKNKKLLFNNSFPAKTKEDILYFTLFVFEQLKIDTEKVYTKLCGNFSEKDENHQLLYEYILNINFGPHHKKIKFPTEFNKIKGHQFHSLFSHIK